MTCRQFPDPSRWMRLQTLSTRNAGYLSCVRLSWGPKRPVRQAVRHFYLVSKTGHGTVLIDRRQKPQTTTGRPTDAGTSDKVIRRDAQVKRKWRLSKAPGSSGRTRFMTTKPYAASAADARTSQGLRPTIDLAPSPVPNRAFPFIKHTDEQAALGLHKPIGLILASAYVLGAACQLSGMLTLHCCTIVADCGNTCLLVERYVQMLIQPRTMYHVSHCSKACSSCQMET